MSTAIHLKRPPAKAETVKFSTAVHGYAYVTMQTANDYLMLIGKPKSLAKKLRELADSIEPTTVKEAHARRVIKELPEALYDPYTAWPWLAERFPWLFDGLNLANEPYAHYFKSNVRKDREQLNRDVQVLRPHMTELINERGAVQRGYTRRAAALLFGNENTNGGNYLRRIQAAIRVLQIELTTTREQLNDSTDEQLAA